MWRFQELNFFWRYDRVWNYPAMGVPTSNSEFPNRTYVMKFLNGRRNIQIRFHAKTHVKITIEKRQIKFECKVSLLYKKILVVNFTMKLKYDC